MLQAGARQDVFPEDAGERVAQERGHCRHLRRRQHLFLPLFVLGVRPLLLLLLLQLLELRLLLLQSLPASFFLLLLLSLSLSPLRALSLFLIFLSLSHLFGLEVEQQRVVSGHFGTTGC